MAAAPYYRRAIAAYPEDCQPTAIEPLGALGGFSGSQFWRLQTHRGLLCLRRWPQERSNPDRLDFIAAVLGHVDRHGFHLVPVPILTRNGATHVSAAGYLWDLAAWMPGCAEKRQSPSAPKIRGGLAALANFHLAAAGFLSTQTGIPAAPGRAASPGLSQRLEQLHQLADDGLERLERQLNRAAWPELYDRAVRVVELFSLAAPRVGATLALAARLPVPLQPCIRDVRRQSVLFEGDHVSGLIDFGAMGFESVAGDVARLLDSLCGDDRSAWRVGRRAYEAVRRLSDDEAVLVEAFDHSGVLLSPLNWLIWIYQEGRQFEDRAGVLARLDHYLPRLIHLVDSC